MIANGPAPEPEPLPVREKYTDAEMAVFERWQRRHGEDPADWSEQDRLTYANTIANMRAGGQL